MSQPSRSVFLVRRLILLGLVSLIIWGLVALVGLIGNALFGGPSATGTNIPESEKCAFGTVSVEAVVTDGSVERAQFDQGMNPHLGYKITNNGATACKWDVGTLVQKFVIKSGEEIIWNNQDCDRSNDESKIVTLQPGQTVASKTSSTDWLRVRSSDTGCGEGQEQVDGRGALYRLIVTIAGVISKEKEFTLF